jgi:hypothetical protein
MEPRNITLKEILAIVLMCTCFDFSVIGMDKTADVKKTTSSLRERQRADLYWSAYRGGYKPHIIQNNEEVKKLTVTGGSFDALWITKEITVPLDLSKCENLEKLIIEGNIIGSLDLSKCKNLMHLLIGGDIRESLNLPKNLFSLKIFGRLSRTATFPTEKSRITRVFIGPHAEINNRLDLSNYSLEKLTILGKLNGGVVPSGDLKKVVISRNAEIAGGLNLSHCAELSEVEVGIGIEEGIFTLPKNPDIICRTLN